MGMRVPAIAIPVRRMDREMHRDATAVGKVPCERAHADHALLRTQLVRQRQFVFPSNPRVGAILGRLRRVPEGLPIARQLISRRAASVGGTISSCPTPRLRV